MLTTDKVPMIIEVDQHFVDIANTAGVGDEILLPQSAVVGQVKNVLFDKPEGVEANFRSVELIDAMIAQYPRNNELKSYKIEVLNLNSDFLNDEALCKLVLRQLKAIEDSIVRGRERYIKKSRDTRSMELSSFPVHLFTAKELQGLELIEACFKNANKLKRQGTFFEENYKYASGFISSTLSEYGQEDGFLRQVCLFNFPLPSLSR